jgi:hypothetical protein
VSTYGEVASSEKLFEINVSPSPVVAKLSILDTTVQYFDGINIDPL